MNPTLSVIDAIARHCSTSRHCILGRDRHKTIALARKVAMYCARIFVLPQPSYPELGRAFGKDHTSIISAVQSVGRLKGDPWVAGAIEVGRRAAVVAVAFPPVDAAADHLADYQVRLGAAE